MGPEEGALEWTMVRRGDVFIMFQKEGPSKDEYPNLKDQQGGSALTICIKVENLEGSYQRIKNDVHTIEEMHETLYGANEFANSGSK